MEEPPCTDHFQAPQVLNVWANHAQYTDHDLLSNSPTTDPCFLFSIIVYTFVIAAADTTMSEKLEQNYNYS